MTPSRALQLYQTWLRSIPHIHVFVYEQQGWRRWKCKAMGYKKISMRESNKPYSWGLGRGKGFPGGSGIRNLPAMQETQETLILGSGRYPGGGLGNSLQCSGLENPLNRGTWWAIVHRVTKGRTQLQRLSTVHREGSGRFRLVGLRFGLNLQAALGIHDAGWWRNRSHQKVWLRLEIWV